MLIYAEIFVKVLGVMMCLFLLSQPHYPLPPGWGMCDGVLALILYFLCEVISPRIFGQISSCKYYNCIILFKKFCIVINRFSSRLQSESWALYDFLNSEVWCHLWTKVGSILKSTASKPDFLSNDGKKNFFFSIGKKLSVQKK